MTQSYAETTFNVPLTGQQISEIYFYLSYWEVQNPNCFDPNDKNYIQEFVDDFEKLQGSLKLPMKKYERNFK